MERPDFPNCPICRQKAIAMFEHGKQIGKTFFSLRRLEFTCKAGHEWSGTKEEQ